MSKKGLSYITFNQFLKIMGGQHQATEQCNSFFYLQNFNEDCMTKHKKIGMYSSLSSIVIFLVNILVQIQIKITSSFPNIVGTGNQILGFGYYLMYFGEIDLRQVEQGFSSIFAKFLPYMIIFLSGAYRTNLREGWFWLAILFILTIFTKITSKKSRHKK